MVGSDNKVPVKILRDTGAFDSFICEDVLALSKETETGTCVPVRGMGLNVLFVPLHKLSLECELFQGEAALAVRLAFPVEGVSIILGNYLAGASMWAGKDPVMRVEAKVAPLEMPEPDKSSQEFPEVFTACAVNRAMKRSNAVKEEKKCHNIALPLSDFPVSLSCSELVVEQQADMSLKGLFAQVRPASEVVDSAWGDFLQDLLLVRKWLPHAGLDGDPVFQIAVPTKFRSAV